MSDRLLDLVAALRNGLPRASVRVDAPDNPAGTTYVDVDAGGRSFSVMVRGGAKLGVVDRAEAGFGDSPDQVFEDVEEAIAFLQREVRLRVFGDRAKEPRPAWHLESLHATGT